MLDMTENVLEDLIWRRLTDSICAVGDLPPRQLSFRTERSTINAVMDVMNAIYQTEVHSR